MRLLKWRRGPLVNNPRKRPPGNDLLLGQVFPQTLVQTVGAFFNLSHRGDREVQADGRNVLGITVSFFSLRR